MEKKPVWDSEPGVAELINEHKVDVLWDLDWEKITAGFKAECLRKLLVKITEVKDRIVAVKACLCHYRYYLIGLDHEQYVECWDGGCPFKDLCEQIIWDLEEICTFTISANGDVRLVPEHECVNRIFRTEQAQKLLARLSPEYCRNGRWVKEVKKAFICQVAHVLSGLLEIPDNKKWIYFEKYWGVTGLAQAWAGRNGKGLDAEIDMLYPEYKVKFRG